MELKVRVLHIISWALLLTLVIASCGPTAAPEPTTGAPAPTEVPPTTAPEAKTGGVLRIGWSQEPDSLNPLVAETVQAGLIFTEGLYESLVRAGEDMLPEPLLAREWEMEDDGKKWTFHLVEDAMWHDGEPFTSADVKFTIDYIKENEIPGLLSYVEAISMVEAPDDHTVVFHYETPLAAILYDLASVAIIPQHVWQGVSSEGGPLTFANPNPVGTGPFKLASWEKQQELVLEANKDYWQGAPYLDRVVFQYFANAGTLLLSLKEGTIDVIPWEIPPTAVNELKQTPGVAVSLQPNFYYRWINFNVSGGGNPALAIKEVRQALNHAIDRQFLVELIHQGYADPGVQVVQKASPLWFNDQIGPYEFDLELAKSLLSEAGFEDTDGDGIREGADGTNLAFTLLIINRWPEEVNSAEQIKQWWKEIGVDLTLQPADSGTILGQTVPLEHDMYLWGFSGGPDPTFSLNIMLERQIGMWNGSGYSNPEYDQLFDLQRETIDEKERQKIVFQMQEMLQEDAPHAVLYYMRAIGAYRSDKFTGFVEMPGGIISSLNTDGLRMVRQVQE